MPGRGLTPALASALDVDRAGVVPHASAEPARRAYREGPPGVQDSITTGASGPGGGASGRGQVPPRTHQPRRCGHGAAGHQHGRREVLARRWWAQAGRPGRHVPRGQRQRASGLGGLTPAP